MHLDAPEASDDHEATDHTEKSHETEVEVAAVPQTQEVAAVASETTAFEVKPVIDAPKEEKEEVGHAAKMAVDTEPVASHEQDGATPENGPDDQPFDEQEFMN